MVNNNKKLLKKKVALLLSSILILVSIISVSLAWVFGAFEPVSNDGDSPYIELRLDAGASELNQAATGQITGVNTASISTGSSTINSSAAELNINFKVTNNGNIPVEFKNVVITINFYASESDMNNNIASGVTNLSGSGYYLTLVAGSGWTSTDNINFTNSAALEIGSSSTIISKLTLNGVNEDSGLVGMFYKINFFIEVGQVSV